MMENLIQILKEIGLQGKEAHIYLALLAIGSNPVSTIAKKAEENRSNCYTILQKLLEKGFVEKFIQGNITYFNAVHPKYVLDQLKAKQYELNLKIDQLDENLHQFQNLKNPCNEKPKVAFYEGKAGIQNIMEDTLRSKDVIRAYASLNALESLLPNYFPQYYRRRTAKGIEVRAIYPANKTTYLHKKRDKDELRESRLIPQEFDFHLDILIYSNKIAITSLKGKFGVLIESREMAEAHKKIFDLIWKGTKVYDEKMTGVIRQQIENKIENKNEVNK